MEYWHPFANLFVGGVIAWFTVKMALKRFYSEKWFERRLDAYTKIIEALHFMKLCTERQIRAVEQGTDLPEDDEKNLVSSYLKGLADLRRYADMGALLLSPDATAILDTLIKELSSAREKQSLWEYLDAEGAAISRCLSELRPIAKRDLNA